MGRRWGVNDLTFMREKLEIRMNKTSAAEVITKCCHQGFSMRKNLKTSYISILKVHSIMNIMVNYRNTFFLAYDGFYFNLLLGICVQQTAVLKRLNVKF